MRAHRSTLTIPRQLLAVSLMIAGCRCTIAAQQHPAEPAADVLAFEQQIEEAIVRGDVAFVDRATSADFTFVHGDGWTHGGQPLMSDDKAAFLKRVADQEYLVHDLDQVKVELHGDVAITSGRYVSLFVPRNRNPSTPARRVYARRNGQWQFLSHRTVHGPTVAPAGIDASAAPATTPRR